MLKDPKPPMIPKETSLTTHPEASTKMYGIKKKIEHRPPGPLANISTH